ANYGLTDCRGIFSDIPSRRSLAWVSRSRFASRIFSAASERPKRRCAMRSSVSPRRTRYRPGASSPNGADFTGGDAAGAGDADGERVSIGGNVSLRSLFAAGGFGFTVVSGNGPRAVSVVARSAGAVGFAGSFPGRNG